MALEPTHDAEPVGCDLDLCGLGPGYGTFVYEVALGVHGHVQSLLFPIYFCSP